MFLSIGPVFVIRTHYEGSEDKTEFNKKNLPLILNFFYKSQVKTIRKQLNLTNPTFIFSHTSQSHTGHYQIKN